MTRPGETLRAILEEVKKQTGNRDQWDKFAKLTDFSARVLLAGAIASAGGFYKCSVDERAAREQALAQQTQRIAALEKFVPHLARQDDRQRRAALRVLELVLGKEDVVRLAELGEDAAGVTVLAQLASGDANQDGANQAKKALERLAEKPTPEAARGFLQLSLKPVDDPVRKVAGEALQRAVEQPSQAMLEAFAQAARDEKEPSGVRAAATERLQQLLPHLDVTSIIQLRYDVAGEEFWTTGFLIEDGAFVASWQNEKADHVRVVQGSSTTPGKVVARDGRYGLVLVKPEAKLAGKALELGMAGTWGIGDVAMLVGIAVETLTIDVGTVRLLTEDTVSYSREGAPRPGVAGAPILDSRGHVMAMQVSSKPNGLAEGVRIHVLRALLASK
jgi:hypothetical protein